MNILPDWPAIDQRIESRLLAGGLDGVLASPDVSQLMCAGEEGLYHAELGELSAVDRPYAAAAREGASFFSSTEVHQACHLARFERLTHTLIAPGDEITEIGAGFGALVRLLRRSGHWGRVTLVDLPGALLMQRGYLGARAVSCRFQARLGDGGGLLIALWSVSEADERMRRDLAERMGQWERFLFAYDCAFAGRDNDAYFASLEELRPDLSWTREEGIGPAPSRYLFGALPP